MTPTEPIRFDVTRSRDGRSFCTRAVVASQEDVGVILTLSLSFQIDESGHDVQTATMPTVAPPEELSGYSWSPMFLRRFATAPQRGGGARGGVAEAARLDRR